MVKFQTCDTSIAWESDHYFVKPREGRGSRGCRVVTKKELHEFIDSLDEKARREWIVMEVLPGKEWTVDVYVRKDGVPLYIVPRERLEVVAGISRKGKTVKHDALIAQTQKLLSMLPFRGPVCIQWKADSEGNPKLLEVNARMSGGIMITVLSGANPMELLALELEGKSPSLIDWEERTVVGYTTYQLL
jgi:carbamoyl-phosphate synthase large subunit